MKLIKKNVKPLKLLSKKQIGNIIGNIHQDSNVTIYTDGSCKNNNKEKIGTFAVIVLYQKKIIFEYSSLSYNTTNNRQELSALIIASQIANSVKTKFSNINITINSDSQYSINTLFNNFNRTKNQDLFKVFDSLNIDNSNFSVLWVKGHNGNIHNEYADKLCLLKYYI